MISILGPPPCFSIIDADADYNGAKCQAEFEGKCSRSKPYVGRGEVSKILESFFYIKGFEISVRDVNLVSKCSHKETCKN